MEARFSDLRPTARTALIKGAMDAVLPTIPAGASWPTRQFNDAVCAQIGVTSKQEAQRVAQAVLKLAPGYQQCRPTGETFKNQRGLLCTRRAWHGPMASSSPSPAPAAPTYTQCIECGTRDGPFKFGFCIPCGEKEI